MGRALPIPPFLVDEARFLLRLFKRPRGIGAIAPSSPRLARALAMQIPQNDGPILELGPGTGVVTEAILKRGIRPEQLTAIEYDPEFAEMVRRRLPRIRVIQGDAFDLERTLGNTPPFAAILSGLPLLNFPPAMRARLLEQIFARLSPGAPFIQFSYGLKPPVPAPDGASVVRAAFIPFNLPPARVWVYRKSHEA
jgi:phosphatidylethanolamine/phosphatidyl-N-methylethanolamine N-methyltransferase